MKKNISPTAPGLFKFEHFEDLSGRSQIILESQQRSDAHGVSRFADASLEQKICSEILRKENTHLLDAAEPVLEHLTSSYSGLYDESIFILANHEAVILSVSNDYALRQADEITDVVPGVDWSEKVRGTNALGTALVAAQPVLIGCGEHHLQRLNNYSCSSVLLNDISGNTVGVLGLARKGVLPIGKDSLLTLALTASHIERRLFVNSQSGNIILAVHSNPLYLDTPWQGLLSISPEGYIMALNDIGCQLFEVNRENVLGLSYKEFLRGLPPPLEHLVKGFAGTIQGSKGLFSYKILSLPERIRKKEFWQHNKKQIAVKSNLLIGCKKISASLQLAGKVFNRDLPVLLTGETGTGKEVIAKLLHQQSNRANKAFVAVNCAAIPEGLIESELFGYREGAFTGARRGGMVGRLEQANGGTLFLDEIGDMPVELQARLLRVLQERKFSPLGAGQEQLLDIGLICATHQDLKQKISDSEFREDLYYRINGVRIYLPALRDRSDILSLFSFFLEREGMKEVNISTELQQLLTNYSWPGNVRQLEMFAQVVAAIVDTDLQQLSLDDLPDSILEEFKEEVGANNTLSIRANEEELIRQAMATYDGNVSSAAKELGVSRATLYRKIKQFNLDDI